MSRSPRSKPLASRVPLILNQTDSSKIGPDGTAYVTRVVPVPSTISPEAQKVLARVVSDAAVSQTLEQRRTGTDKWQAGAGEFRAVETIGQAAPQRKTARRAPLPV